jgi:fatty acid-binding protein DegV
VGKKFTGNYKRAAQKYVEDQLKGRDDLDLKRIFITHSGVDQAIMDFVRETVLALQPFEETPFTRAGCTISSHCGPGTLGILFITK